MKALVLTPGALFRLSQFSIEPNWFDSFGVPAGDHSLKRVVVQDMVYLIEPDLESDEGPIVVISLEGRDSVLGDPSTRGATLERIITTGRWIYTDSVNIPPAWRKHHQDSLFSIQAGPRAYDWRPRVHFDKNPRGSQDLFAFSRTKDTVVFTGLDRHLDLYDAARENFTEVVLAPHDMGAPNGDGNGITLSHRLPQGFVQGATLEQWYASKLTNEQRFFVDRPHDGPVRLRGAAGTGKTLSLVVKFLRDGIQAEKEGRRLKVGFVTHSFASVDLITSIAESLDRTGLFHIPGDHVKLEVRTLYDLAHTHLNFELSQLQPLSLDGREGRRLQGELIETSLKEMGGSAIARAQFGGLSPEIAQRWDDVVDGRNRRLVAEVMNEFASVLDAEGVRAGEERGEKYAKGSSSRPTWLMHLPTELDRRFVLEVHRRYRKILGEMDTLSVDQMVGDFNAFLDSNRWDRIRARDGYDVLFVDELHLFTSIERQTLHKLFRRNTDDAGIPRRPPIFMAYDLKQSPQDTFASYLDGDSNLFSASTGLQGSELIKLEQVFRYTPQIAEFLADLDATFPAINIPDEWEAYTGRAEGDGEAPELTVFPDELSLFRTVLTQAHQTARIIDGGGRRVAVLCASEEQFDKYLPIAAGQFEGKHVAIVSREPSSELRHAGKRFILSMPEYVAGLQFDTVFLIHVDASDAPVGSADGVRRRFISNIYLGSSRAEKSLRISACLTRGGKSDILDMALERKSLIERAPPAPIKASR